MVAIGNDLRPRPMDHVSVVFFDFDGTLVFHRPDSFDIIKAYCTEIGQPIDPESERQGRRVRHQYFVDPDIRDQIDGLPRDQFWQHFNRHLLKAVGTQGDLDRLAADVTERLEATELVYHCPQAGCHTLAELRAREYRLGLITNRTNVARFYDLLDGMALRSHFDMVLASGEVGISKPDPGIFGAALERMGAQAGESLYVGDNYWADVVGARRAGLTPVLFDPYQLFPAVDCLIVECIEDLLAWLP
jgi:putative hydrolase of the HAD superfamily